MLAKLNYKIYNKELLVIVFNINIINLIFFA